MTDKELIQFAKIIDGWLEYWDIAEGKDSSRVCLAELALQSVLNGYPHIIHEISKC